MENNFNQYLIEQLANKKADLKEEDLESLRYNYYKLQHEKCDLKVGDKVKLKRKWFDGENNNHISFHNQYIKEVGKITQIMEKTDCSYRLDLGFFAPYFVLEKVEEEYIPLDYSDDLVGKVVVSKDANIKRLIVSQNESTVFTGGSSWDYSYQTLMDGFTFQDGTACHKLKQ